MNGKLGWYGAYNRSRTLGPITSNKAGEEMDNTRHPHYERELKILRAENAKLKGDYDELNATLKQLVTETSHEKFDERRTNLLKLQIIQLERQVAVLNEALGCRHEAAMEVENTMAWLADKLRSYISADVKGPMVPIARVDLMSMVENSESARIKLFKAVEGSGKQCVGKDLLLLNPFLGGKYKEQQVSLLDICLDKFNYLNFRHVACLESKLCTLYKDLIRVFEQLEYVTRSPVGLTLRQGDNAESSRLQTTILRACMSLRDATDDLLALSLLCPSSPWPVLKRPLTKHIPVDRITAALPNGLPRVKEEEITHLLEASIGACNHRYHLLEKEKTVLKEELTFHRATHNLQVQYIKCLFEAVRKGYGEFESSAKETIAKPIKALLDAYRKLKDSASEQALRDFLVVIKENEGQLSSVEEMLAEKEFGKDATGALAFSKFGSEFLSKLDALAEQCKKERDKAIAARKDVAEEQQQKDAKLQQMIEDLEIKYEKQWNPVKTNAKTTRDELLVNKIQPGSIHSADGRSEMDSLISSSRCTSAKSLKDDPTVLRSFLYADVTDNNGTANKGDCSTSRSHTNESPHTKALKSSIKGERKMLKKGTKWKPDKEWVNDFSGSVEDSELTHATSADCAHLSKKVKNQECKEWNNGSLQPPLDSIKSANTPQLAGTSPIEGDFSSAKDSLHASVIKATKPLTYEPRLYVANRTLKLRRAGSISSTASLNQAFSDKNDSEVVEEVEGANKNTPEVHSKPVKSKELQQKPSTLHKRNSWR